jgi:hypothetical protein
MLRANPRWISHLGKKGCVEDGAGLALVVEWRCINGMSRLP